MIPGPVDAIDAVIVAAAAGTGNDGADIDFSGDVDAQDFIAVVGDIDAPGANLPAPWEFIRLLLVDPLLYNEGYQFIPMLEGYLDPELPDAGDPPCEAEKEAALQAAEDWATELMRMLKYPFPFWDYPEWKLRVDALKRRSRAANQELQDCLAANDLPPWVPGTPLDPSNPDDGDDDGDDGDGDGDGTDPDTGCPLDDSFPPPTPTDPDMDPCFNQMQTNLLLCITCRGFGVSSEPYSDCLQRVREIHNACTGDGTASE